MARALLAWIAFLLCQYEAAAFQACTSSLFSRSGVRLNNAVPDASLSVLQRKPARLFDQSYSASDWWHNIQSLPRSTVLREIKGPVLAVVVWSAMVTIFYTLLVKSGRTGMLNHLTLSSKPHSLLVSSLGLLLVFRTNSAYQRFAEGRKIWEKILSVSRNMSRMATLYEREVGAPRLNRILRLLAAFPYLLRHHVQPRCMCKEDLDLLQNDDALMLDESQTAAYGSRRQISTARLQQCCVDRRSLPWCLLPPITLQKCVDSSNRPLWVCDRLSEEINNVLYTDNFTSRERLTFLSQIGKLSESVGECERIHQTAVPLNYARHSLRSLTLWLFTLPFCLVGELQLLTAPVMGAIAWLMLGVYQIGYTIEDPFQGSLRLAVLCDDIYHDVMAGTDGTLLNRQSAFEMDSVELEEWSDMPPEPKLMQQQDSLKRP